MYRLAHVRTAKDILTPLGFVRHLYAVLNVARGGLISAGVVCSSWSRINSYSAMVLSASALLFLLCVAQVLVHHPSAHLRPHGFKSPRRPAPWTKLYSGCGCVCVWAPRRCNACLCSHEPRSRDYVVKANLMVSRVACPYLPLVLRCSG